MPRHAQMTRELEEDLDSVYGSPISMAVSLGSERDVQTAIDRMVDGRLHVDRGDPISGITPLQMCCFREEDEAVAIAKVLLQNGARVETPDPLEGATPILMAAQEGKVGLVELLIERGAVIDASIGGHSLPIYVAVQNNHLKCVALLLNVAAAKGQKIVDSLGRSGFTPLQIAVSLGFAEVAGALIKAGADVRLGTPACYSVRRGDEHLDNFDPGPEFPVHWAVDTAVRSMAARACAECKQTGKGGQKLSKCSKCGVTYFCDRDCQTKNWKSHKKCCERLHQGASLVTGEPNAQPHKVIKQVAGFEDAFGAIDQAYDGCPGYYVRETHPVWEYNIGARGKQEWKRYPDRIEAALEALSKMGAPNLMYRPGDPDCDGMQEMHRTSGVPPAGVATRHVTFCDMTEREVYTGASRMVRRNGKSKRPKPSEDPWAL